MSYAPGTQRRAAAGASAPPAIPSSAKSRAQAEHAAGQLPPSTTVETAEPVRAAKPRVPVDESWFDRLRRRMSSDEGASWGVSLLVHLIILAILAIPVFRHVTRNDPLIATVVAEAAGGGSPFGLPDMINTELAPAQPLANAPSQLATPDLASEETLAVSKALLGTPDGEGGQGTGKGSGIGPGDVGHGMMQFVPKNAVRAGSFAAWTTPVYDNRFPRPFGAPEPQPGDSPRPLQKYWITIQIKVPGSRRRYSIHDLSGEVIGTDTYRQEIPKNTYRLTEDGKLLPLRNGGRVPVVDGVVQFVVVVPGARNLVKDTIVVKSKLLKEEHEMELVFKDDDADDRDFTSDL